MVVVPLSVRPTRFMSRVFHEGKQKRTSSSPNNRVRSVLTLRP